MEKVEDASEMAKRSCLEVGRRLMTLELGTYPTARHLARDVVRYGRSIDHFTMDRLNEEVSISPVVKKIDLRLVTGVDLGIPFSGECLVGDFYDLAFSHGLELCLSEIAPLLSLHANGLGPTWIVSGFDGVHFFVCKNEIRSIRRENISTMILSLDSVHVFMSPQSE